MHVSDSELHVLDLASGNGVLAAGVLRSNSRAHVTLVDDSWLAVESSKFNVSDKSATFIWDDGLEMFPSEEFDLVVSNPPFHFGHETNIEVSLALFEGVSRCLKSDGRFVLVANRHLNYKTHLIKLFRSVTILNENDKFIVYQCHL